jgi:hypothetical protein
MHLSPLSDANPSDDNPGDYTLIGALRRMQYGLIAALLAIATVCVINGLGT